MKIFIMGPTGVGKTKLSVELAKIFDAYIINCDAVQVYKGLDIGSAKVTEEEKCGIKHFLFDIKNPDEEYNVKDYQTDLRNLFDKYSDKNLIIVGGTGLYATAGAYDYRFNEEERFLQKDITSLVEPKLLYPDAHFIGLTTSRENLYQIINKRVDKMVKDGLIDEVKELYKKYPNSLILKRAIGYKEIIDYLDNKITLEEAVDEIKKNSRHYAKRQYTWFNNKMDIKWFEVNFNYFNETIDNVKDYLNSCK